MARSRNIKPGFFVNDLLGELPTLYRLLFIALWGQADRDGRLEDRPKRIKVLALPYDEINIDEALSELHRSGFIERYQVKGERFIQVINFCKHQHPHHKERESTIPAPGKPETSPGPVPEKASPGPSDSLNLIPDSLINGSSGDDRFDEWWAAYPRKRKKKAARVLWKKMKLDQQADMIIADTVKRSEQDGIWKDGFTPDPTTYLSGERWDDEITLPRENNKGAGLMLPKLDEKLEAWAITHNHRGPRVGESYAEYRQALAAAATNKERCKRTSLN